MERKIKKTLVLKFIFYNRIIYKKFISKIPKFIFLINLTLN